MESAETNQTEDRPSGQDQELSLTGAYRDALNTEETKYRVRGCLPVKKLLGAWTVPRIAETDDGYQRPVSPGKIRSISKSIQGGGSIKGSIAMVVPECCCPKWSRNNRKLEMKISDMAKLRVLDGQHRLLGLEAYLEACNASGTAPRDLPPLQLELYVGLSPSDEAALFEEINGTQTKVSNSHLAEVRHRFGHENDVESVASSVFDELMAGPLAGAQIGRSNFLKIAKPLLAPARGGRVNLKLENRRELLVLYLTALAQVMRGSPNQQVQESLKLNCTVRGACSVFEEILYQAVQQSFVTAGLEGFVGFMWSLERLNVFELPAKSGSVVADAIRELLFPVLDVDPLLLPSSSGSREEEEAGDE